MLKDALYCRYKEYRAAIQTRMARLVATSAADPSDPVDVSASIIQKLFGLSDDLNVR
jgi:hypothetical protein